jgi:hypothetical protein
MSSLPTAGRKSREAIVDNLWMAPQWGIRGQRAKTAEICGVFAVLTAFSLTLCGLYRSLTRKVER